MKGAKDEPQKSEEFTRFEEMTRKLVSVPKGEIDKREAEYQRQREEKRKRPAKR